MSEVSYLEYKGKHKGLFAWILSTDHKRIAMLYLAALIVFFLTAVTFGVLMRLEMLSMGKTIVDPQTYNALFTLHGVIMIFLFIIPGIPAVFGNFFLPIMLGAKDVSFPRLNLLSWYFYIIGAFLVLLSLFVGGGPRQSADHGLIPRAVFPGWRQGARAPFRRSRRGGGAPGRSRRRGALPRLRTPRRPSRAPRRPESWEGP